MLNYPCPQLLSQYDIISISPEQSGLNDEQSEDCNSYILSCKCGNKRFNIEVSSKNGDYLLPPIYTICSSCQKRILLFDPLVHGFDVQTNSDSKTVKSSKNGIIYNCSICELSGLISVSFEYAIDENTIEEIANQNPENWFTWIYVFHKCMSEDKFHLLFDYECA